MPARSARRSTTAKHPPADCPKAMNIGCLYESGWWGPIVFATFSMKWLTENA